MQRLETVPDALHRPAERKDPSGAGKLGRALLARPNVSPLVVAVVAGVGRGVAHVNVVPIIRAPSVTRP